MHSYHRRHPKEKQEDELHSGHNPTYSSLYISGLSLVEVRPMTLSKSTATEGEVSTFSLLQAEDANSRGYIN